MYQIKNGILHKDGKKIFALGESYYPSFHPCKFPVKPTDDRMGEMVKDLRMMAEAGFNHVRLAALGDLRYDAQENRVELDSPFVDAMVREAEKNDLSVSVRLQGFSVNLRGFTDADMLDERGYVPHYTWGDFVRTTLHHEGILADNYVYARDLAAHFSTFPNVVGHQIYNEPHFPQVPRLTTDYNPHAIAAFRKWLVKKGILTEQTAEHYRPPKGRKTQGAEAWALWRTFCSESLNNFLKNAGEGAKAGADLPIFTCTTATMGTQVMPRLGVDPFAQAKVMDIVGYTIYKHAWGAEYYSMCLEGDIYQSAAAAENKESWCIELDSRTYIPPSVYNRGTYATLGSGVKGIIYYQWRGDQPVKGVPFPNSCGILNYDGTKTANFDNAVAVNHWILSVSDLLLGASRAQEGIGLFYSAHAITICDALENDDDSSKVYNSALPCYHHLYEDLRRTGYTVTFTTCEQLQKRPSALRVLIVPDYTHLSPEEKAAIEQFYLQGGMVFKNYDFSERCNAFFGLFRHDNLSRTYEETRFLPPYTAADLPELTGILPIASALVPNLGIQALQNDEYTLLVLTNLSPVKQQMDAVLRVNIAFDHAEFTAIDGTKKIDIHGDILTVRDMTDGGMIVLRHSFKMPV